MPINPSSFLYDVSDFCTQHFEGVPHVTLFFIILNVATFMGIFSFKSDKPIFEDVCLGVTQASTNGEYWRLVISPFYHFNELHLYYTMISFLSKGVILEKKIGSKKFFFIVLIFSFLSNLIEFFINKFLAENYNSDYYHICSAGFSGVIFALKILISNTDENQSGYLFGFIPISPRYTGWMELVLVQILAPTSSFTGHLAGLIIGYLYVLGPLEFLMNKISSLFSNQTQNVRFRFVGNASLR